MESEPLTDEQDVGVEVAEAPEQPPELTHLKISDTQRDRLIAIAKGEDPDAVLSPSAPAGQDATTAQGSAGAEVNESTDDGDETPPPAPTAWYSDRDKAYAEQYGIGEFELAQLGSREALSVLAHQIDRAKAAQAKVEKQPTAESGELTPLDENGLTNVEYYRQNGYDEATIALAEATRKAQEDAASVKAERERDRQAQHATEQQRYIESVHDAIDAIGLDDFFGKSVDQRGNPVELSAKHLNRRAKLHDELIALEIGYAQSGRTVPPLRTLVEKARLMAFGDELASQKRHDRLSRVAAQSQTRRPVGSGTSASSAMRGAPPVDPNSTEAILSQPDIQKFLKSVEETRGVRL